MIKYHGIKWKNNTAFLLFANEMNQEVEVPVDMIVADRITKYLERIGTPAPVMERGNDDEAD